MFSLGHCWRDHGDEAPSGVARARRAVIGRVFASGYGRGDRILTRAVPELGTGSETVHRARLDAAGAEVNEAIKIWLERNSKLTLVVRSGTSREVPHRTYSFVAPSAPRKSSPSLVTAPLRDTRGSDGLPATCSRREPARAIAGAQPGLGGALPVGVDRWAEDGRYL